MAKSINRLKVKRVAPSRALFGHRSLILSLAANALLEGTLPIPGAPMTRDYGVTGRSLRCLTPCIAQPRLSQRPGADVASVRCPCGIVLPSQSSSPQVTPAAADGPSDYVDSRCARIATRASTKPTGEPEWRAPSIVRAREYRRGLQSEQ